MNIYALIPLLNVFAYAALLGLGLRHRYRRERRAFALYLAAAGFWSFVSLYLEIGMGKSLHLGWIRVRQTDVSVVM